MSPIRRRAHTWLAGAIGLVVVAHVSIASQGPSTSDIRALLDAGSYELAERAAQQLISHTETRFGSGSSDSARAQDLLVEASVQNGNGAAPEILRLAESIVAVKERLRGSEDLETAISLHNLGAVRGSRGEFAAARPIHERALAIRRDKLGPSHPAVADSLDRLAFVLIQLRRFDDARRALDQSRAIRERANESPIRLAATLQLIGLLHRWSGTYAEGVQPIETALALLRRVAPLHPELASTLQIFGDLQFLAGDVRGAETTWRSALALAEHTLRDGHPALAEFVRRVGLAAYSQGDLAEARQLRERALTIGEKSLAPCDPALAFLVNSVAASRLWDGEYGAVRQLYDRIITTIGRCTDGKLANSADVYATAIYNEGELAQETGDLREAMRLYERAVQVWSSALGQNHPFTLRALDSVAETAEAQGQTAKARALYERVLESRRRALGASHPQVAWTLTNLARTVANSGNVALAIRYASDAAAIYQQSGAADEPDHFARVLELRGTLEARQQDWTAARASFSSALAERERIFGASHPLAAETRAALARVDFAQGALDAAVDNALAAEQAVRDHLRFTVRYLPERQALAYAASRPHALDLALSAVAVDHTDARRVFDAVVRSRGALLDEFAARARLAGAASPELAVLNASVVAARQRFANLVLRSLQEPVPRSIVDEARVRKEAAERALAEQSADARAELARASVGLAEIARALPSRGALVSFIRYERRTRREPSAGSGQSASAYAAFVVRADSSDAAFVPLGTAALVERRIRAWQTQATAVTSATTVSERPYRLAATSLREAVWDPIAAHLTHIDRVFLVPDGVLNVVSFAALPMPDGRYLAEGDLVVHYLSTERDLIPAGTAAEGRSLLALGGPAFDARRATPVTQSTRRSGCAVLARIQFEDLPGSRREAAEISQVWNAANMGAADVLTGADASEAALKKGIGNRRVVHLATHGFVFGGDCPTAGNGTRAVGAVVPASGAISAAVADNPLLVSGLALAGANSRATARDDEEDGILSGEEVAGLNLEGTEWAVLSACETGLGEIRAGEGVFGLRRAFQIAGVRTVIMSLWSVDDQATRLWMRALYEGRFQRHLSTADAVREASLTVLRDRRARGLSTHPFYWAAFVAAGDWR